MTDHAKALREVGTNYLADGWELRRDACYAAAAEIEHLTEMGRIWTANEQALADNANEKDAEIERRTIGFNELLVERNNLLSDVKILTAALEEIASHRYPLDSQQYFDMRYEAGREAAAGIARAAIKGEG